MRFDGRLKSWNDERGFGFIEPLKGGEDIFVHIKAFPSGTGRPSVGQSLTFEVETTKQGRKRAQRVQYPYQRAPIRTSRSESQAPWTPAKLAAIPAFLALYYWVASHWGSSPIVAILYGALTLITFLAYAVDKSAALRAQWRTHEQTLHTLSLAGGWPGALLAQQLLRHKTSKESFIAIFWLTVLVNVGGFVAFHWLRRVVS